MKAVILAAGVGTRLRPQTDETPKGLLPVAGRPIIDYTLEALGHTGIKEVVVVTGHLADQLARHVTRSPVPCRTIYNPRYATANNYYSLLVAEDALGGEPFVKVDSDLIFEPDLLTRLLSAEGDLCLALDSGVQLGIEEMKVQMDNQGRVTAVSKTLDPAACLGESIGLERISSEFAPVLFRTLRQLDAEEFTDAYYEDAYHRLACEGGHDIRAVDISGLSWTEIDDSVDLSRANELFGG